MRVWILALALACAGVLNGSEHLVPVYGCVDAPDAVKKVPGGTTAWGTVQPSTVGHDRMLLMGYAKITIANDSSANGSRALEQIKRTRSPNDATRYLKLMRGTFGWDPTKSAYVAWNLDFDNGLETFSILAVPNEVAIVFQPSFTESFIWIASLKSTTGDPSPSTYRRTIHRLRHGALFQNAAQAREFSVHRSWLPQSTPGIPVIIPGTMTLPVGMTEISGKLYAKPQGSITTLGKTITGYHNDNNRGWNIGYVAKDMNAIPMLSMSGILVTDRNGDGQFNATDLWVGRSDGSAITPSGWQDTIVVSDADNALVRIATENAQSQITSVHYVLSAAGTTLVGLGSWANPSSEAKDDWLYGYRRVFATVPVSGVTTTDYIAHYRRSVAEGLITQSGGISVTIPSTQVTTLPSWAQTAIADAGLNPALGSWAQVDQAFRDEQSQVPYAAPIVAAPGRSSTKAQWIKQTLDARWGTDIASSTAAQMYQNNQSSMNFGGHSGQEVVSFRQDSSIMSGGTQQRSITMSDYVNHEAIMTSQSATNVTSVNAMNIYNEEQNRTREILMTTPTPKAPVGRPDFGDWRPGDPIGQRQDDAPTPANLVDVRIAVGNDMAQEMEGGFQRSARAKDRKKAFMWPAGVLASDVVPPWTQATFPDPTDVAFPGRGDGDNPHRAKPGIVEPIAGLPFYDHDGDGDLDRFWTSDPYGNGYTHLRIRWHLIGDTFKIKTGFGPGMVGFMRNGLGMGSKYSPFSGSGNMAKQAMFSISGIVMRDDGSVKLEEVLFWGNDTAFMLNRKKKRRFFDVNWYFGPSLCGFLTGANINETSDPPPNPDDLRFLRVMYAGAPPPPESIPMPTEPAPEINTTTYHVYATLSGGETRNPNAANLVKIQTVTGPKPVILRTVTETLTAYRYNQDSSFVNQEYGTHTSTLPNFVPAAHPMTFGAATFGTPIIDPLSFNKPDYPCTISQHVTTNNWTITMINGQPSYAGGSPLDPVVKTIAYPRDMMGGGLYTDPLTGNVEEVLALKFSPIHDDQNNDGFADTNPSGQLIDTDPDTGEVTIVSEQGQWVDVQTGQVVANPSAYFQQGGIRVPANACEVIVRNAAGLTVGYYAYQQIPVPANSTPTIQEPPSESDFWMFGYRNFLSDVNNDGVVDTDDECRSMMRRMWRDNDQSGAMNAYRAGIAEVLADEDQRNDIGNAIIAIGGTITSVLGIAGTIASLMGTIGASVATIAAATGAAMVAVIAVAFLAVAILSIVQRNDNPVPRGDTNTIPWNEWARGFHAGGGFQMNTDAVKNSSQAAALGIDGELPVVTSTGNLRGQTNGVIEILLHASDDVGPATNPWLFRTMNRMIGPVSVGSTGAEDWDLVPGKNGVRKNGTGDRMYRVDTGFGWYMHLGAQYRFFNEVQQGLLLREKYKWEFRAPESLMIRQFVNNFDPYSPYLNSVVPQVLPMTAGDTSGFASAQQANTVYANSRQSTFTGNGGATNQYMSMVDDGAIVGRMRDKTLFEFVSEYPAMDLVNLPVDFLRTAGSHGNAMPIAWPNTWSPITKGINFDTVVERRKRLRDPIFVFSGFRGREWEVEMAKRTPSNTRLVCVEWEDKATLDAEFRAAGRKIEFAYKKKIVTESTGVGDTTTTKVFSSTQEDQTLTEDQVFAQIAQDFFGVEKVFEITTNNGKGTADGSGNFFDKVVARLAQQSSFEKTGKTTDVRPPYVDQVIRNGNAAFLTTMPDGRPSILISRQDQPNFVFPNEQESAASAWNNPDLLAAKPNPSGTSFPIYWRNKDRINVLRWKAGSASSGAAAIPLAPNVDTVAYEFGMIEFRHPMLVYYHDRTSSSYVHYGTNANPANIFEEDRWSQHALEGQPAFNSAEYLRRKQFEQDWVKPCSLEEIYDQMRPASAARAAAFLALKQPIPVADPGNEPQPPAQPTYTGPTVPVQPAASIRQWRPYGQPPSYSTDANEFSNVTYGLDPTWFFWRTDVNTSLVVGGDFAAEASKFYEIYGTTSISSKITGVSYQSGSYTFKNGSTPAFSADGKSVSSTYGFDDNHWHQFQVAVKGTAKIRITVARANNLTISITGPNAFSYSQFVNHGSFSVCDPVLSTPQSSYDITLPGTGNYEVRFNSGNVGGCSGGVSYHAMNLAITTPDIPDVIPYITYYQSIWYERQAMLTFKAGLPSTVGMGFQYFGINAGSYQYAPTASFGSSYNTWWPNGNGAINAWALTQPHTTVVKDLLVHVPQNYTITIFGSSSSETVNAQGTIGRAMMKMNAFTQWPDERTNIMTYYSKDGMGGKGHYFTAPSWYDTPIPPFYLGAQEKTMRLKMVYTIPANAVMEPNEWTYASWTGFVHPTSGTITAGDLGYHLFIANSSNTKKQRISATISGPNGPRVYNKPELNGGTAYSMPFFAYPGETVDLVYEIDPDIGGSTDEIWTWTRVHYPRIKIPNPADATAIRKAAFEFAFVRTMGLMNTFAEWLTASEFATQALEQFNQSVMVDWQRRQQAFPSLHAEWEIKKRAWDVYRAENTQWMAENAWYQSYVAARNAWVSMITTDAGVNNPEVDWPKRDGSLDLVGTGVNDFGSMPMTSPIFQAYRFVYDDSYPGGITKDLMAVRSCQ